MTDEATLDAIAEQMADAIREWNRAKLEREEWRPIPGQVPPQNLLGNARKANQMLTSALEKYEAFKTISAGPINTIERKKRLADEIASVICTLANIVEDWNDAEAETDERGPGHGAIGLVVFDDGSGCVAEFQQSPDANPLGNGFVVKDFSNPEYAQEWFFENISGRSLFT